MGKREDRSVALARQANACYADHALISQASDRWIIGRPGSSAFRTEVINLTLGGVYVGGDIDHLIFRYSQDEGIERVRWMSRRRDAADSYFLEKASIGSGRKLVYAWDLAVALDDLADINPEDYGMTADGLSDLLESLESSVCQYDFQSRLHEHGSFDDDDLKYGEIPDQRCYHVMAALKKLDALTPLDEEA